MLVAAEPDSAGKDRLVSRTAEDASNGAKHPDSVNQEMLKDRLGSSTDYCTAQTERRLSSVGCQCQTEWPTLRLISVTATTGQIPPFPGKGPHRNLLCVVFDSGERIQKARVKARNSFPGSGD